MSTMQLPVLGFGMESMNESFEPDEQGMKSVLTRMAESDKWRPWVEDIEDPYTRGLTAFLMEAEERYAKVGVPSSGLFTEDTVTSGIATFTNFALPLVRSIVPNLIANEIVSMQPINHMGLN